MQVFHTLRDQILDGRFQPGELLGSTRGYAKELRVSRNTIMNAYAMLAAEGLVEGNYGAGTRVRLDVRALQTRRAPEGRVLEPREIFDTLVPPQPEKPKRWDFSIGTPDPALFPYDDWRRLLARQLRRKPKSSNYLPPEGEAKLREAIAHAIGLSRSVRCAPEDLLITSGAQQAFDLISRVLVNPGEVVAVEDPGYPFARELFELNGARVARVPVDEEGLVVEKLPRDARLVYVTPSHQFPLGVSMTLQRRQALLDWSAKTGAAILEDDYDSEFRYDGRPLEPLQSIDRAGRVIYVGTFSKTLLPKLRLGFLVAPRSLMPALKLVKARLDNFTMPEPQLALAEFLRDGLFARHVRKLTRIYGERHAQLHASLRKHFGKRVQILPGAAGLHLSVRVGKKLHTLGFGNIDAAQIDDAIADLARLKNI